LCKKKIEQSFDELSIMPDCFITSEEVLTKPKKVSNKKKKELEQVEEKSSGEDDF